ncbi:12040_t:CDS:2 [Acaulospora morrowiae]|uniref:ethanolamine kinase n=1 Tax=Acaulospora morrowiae TaxID=94023 RepID=A0A9N9FMV3_9GLOM|nr:12040_t:CDS:2 [Acaulospora morrowiae]
MWKRYLYVSNVRSSTLNMETYKLNLTSKKELKSHIEELETLDYVVSTTNLFEDCAHVVMKFFRSWKENDLEFVRCKDGITNKLVKCTNRSLEFSILIRIYGSGTEKFIDREQETMASINMVTLSELGLACPIYGRFKNGLVYGYKPGRVFSVSDMSDPYKSSLVAKELAVWHRVTIAGDRKPDLFFTIHRWIKEVPKTYTNPEVDERFRKNFNIEELNKELSDLEQELAKVKSPVVFCHNDLLHANIIYNDAMNEVSFIDYEYATFNPQAFDIGNHFNEFGGIACDYSLYPTKEFQLQFLEQYLRAYNPDASVVTAERINELYREANKFALASHFYWGTWALLQANLSDLDFDFMGYAILRFNEYYKKKNDFLEL